ncbi:hypothetical protein Agub_g3388, partial [Astrephomene gubernaculifera]
MLSTGGGAAKPVSLPPTAAPCRKPGRISRHVCGIRLLGVKARHASVRLQPCRANRQQHWRTQPVHGPGSRGLARPAPGSLDALPAPVRFIGCFFLFLIAFNLVRSAVLFWLRIWPQVQRQFNRQRPPSQWGPEAFGPADSDAPEAADGSTAAAAPVIAAEAAAETAVAVGRATAAQPAAHQATDAIPVPAVEVVVEPEVLGDSRQDAGGYRQQQQQQQQLVAAVQPSNNLGRVVFCATLAPPST